MNNVISFLKDNKVNYKLHEHPPFYTCEDSNKHGFPKNGAHCKNLFIKNRKSKRFFLYIIPSHKRASIAELEEIIGEKLKFASPSNLKEILNVEPGSVSFFGLLNDKEIVVELLLDKEIYDADYVNFHPNDNTKTIEISKKNFHFLLNMIANEYKII